jgi:glycosyltransferase involved in cell wall biosynthesis
MKIGFFSPLPPSPTGVSDYSAALLAEMQKSGEVIANLPGDVNLYHLGNNHLHREIYARALAEPGVVVLHDAVLQHFFLGTLTEPAYIEEFVFNYGEWTRDLARELWKNRARSAADPRYFEYAMLKRVVVSSKAVIVHNPAAAEAVRRHGRETEVFEIPHLFLAPPTPSKEEVEALRSSLGVGPGVLLTGVFGHLRESKRLSVVLRAMERLWRDGVEVVLLVQGEFASTDLERALRDQLRSPRILRAGYLPAREFWRYAAATDVCINLRFPSAGETSGIAISMMGIEKPVIFTAGAETSRFPENACLRLELGPVEDEHLAGLIRWVASDRSALAEIGRRAGAYIGMEHNAAVVAARFWEVCGAGWHPAADW